MLKELNINVEIRTYEQATYIQALNEHEHDMGFSAWITSTGDADYTYYPCYHSTQKGKPGNRSFFDNPKADELIEKGPQSERSRGAQGGLLRAQPDHL